MNKYVAAGLIGLSMALGSGAAAAGDTAIQIAPRVGLGRLHIAPDHSLTQIDEESDALAVGVTVGVVTPIGLMFEVGAFNYSNFSLFGANERRHLDEGTLAVGYQFESANGFRVVPKFGRMKWRLSDTEGQLFNPGPEAQRIEHGYDKFWQLTLQKRIAKWFSLGLDLKGESFDFGSARAAMVVATFDM